MSENKNIDRLFKEKFKDFEVTPPPSAWENIQIKMNTNQQGKNYFLMLWLTFCGFAAVVFIGFSIVTTFIINPTSDSENAVFVSSPEEITKLPSTMENPVITKQSRAINNTIRKLRNTTSGNNFSTANSNTISTNKSADVALHSEKNNTKSSEQSNLKHNRKFAERSVHDKTRKNNIAKQNQTPSTNIQLATITSGSQPKNTPDNTPITTTNTSVVLLDKNSSNSFFKTTEKAFETTEEAISEKEESEFLYLQNNSKVAYEVGKENYSKTEIANAAITLSDKNIAFTDKNKTPENENKNILNKRISNTDNFITEEPVVVAEQNNTLEKGKPTEKTTSEKNTEDPKEKNTIWTVSTTVAPVFFTLNGSGSIIDPIFKDNAKSYQTNTSYGVGLQYALNEKWSIRSGVNALQFEYNTNDVVFYESTSAKGLQHVTPNSTGSGIAVETLNPRLLSYTNGTLVISKEAALLKQKMGYIEVPIEASYKLINKKININLIGGLSSMFLTENTVALNNTNRNITIGKANNLNTVHFSTNVGVGFRYQFLKSFEANLEPTFKYQLNTFSEQSGDFKPYLIGVYTGISYKF